MSLTVALAAAIFLLTCIVPGVGGLPRLRLDRTGATLAWGCGWLRT